MFFPTTLRRAWGPDTARRLRRAQASFALLACLGLSMVGASGAAAIGPGVAIVTTDVHDEHHDAVTSVPVGMEVHPSFYVSGLSGPATGSISVFQFDNATCSGLWDYVYGGVLSATGRLDAHFLAETSNEPTTISYRGDYQGNGTYGAVQGPCKSVTFTKATPSVVLRMHNAVHQAVTTAMIGTTLHAFVEVDGGADTPTGSVRIRYWPNGTCSGSSSLVGPYTLGGGQVDTPYGWAMNTEGSFSFRADYAGDSSYSAANSPCLSMPVEKYTPSLASQVHDPGHDAVTTVLVGTTVHVSGTLSGFLGTPTGTVSVRHFTNGSCDGGASFAQNIPAAAVMDPAGSPVDVDVPYTLRLQLAYQGDANYAAVTGPCMTITWKATPTVGLTVHDAGHDAVTSAYVGAPLHLRAVVGGDFDTPTGKVKLNRYSNDSCSGSGTTIASPALSSGVVDNGGLDVSFATPGTYSFKAIYQGDGTYVSKGSACATVTITTVPATPKPTVAPTAAPVATPKPTVAPTAAPTIAPQPTSNPAAPSPTAAAAASTEPSVPGLPAESAPAPSAAPATDAPAAPAGTTAPAGDPAAPAGDEADSGSGPSMLVALPVLLLFGGSLFAWLARRRREEDRKLG